MFMYRPPRAQSQPLAHVSVVDKREELRLGNRAEVSIADLEDGEVDHLVALYEAGGPESRARARANLALANAGLGDLVHREPRAGVSPARHEASSASLTSRSPAGSVFASTAVSCRAPHFLQNVASASFTTPHPMHAEWAIKAAEAGNEELAASCADSALQLLLADWTAEADKVLEVMAATRKSAEPRFFVGTGKGCNSPMGTWLLGLLDWHGKQLVTYALISACMPGQVSRACGMPAVLWLQKFARMA